MTSLRQSCFDTIGSDGCKCTFFGIAMDSSDVDLIEFISLKFSLDFNVTALAFKFQYLVYAPSFWSIKLSSNGMHCIGLIMCSGFSTVKKQRYKRNITLLVGFSMKLRSGRCLGEILPFIYYRE